MTCKIFFCNFPVINNFDPILVFVLCFNALPLVRPFHVPASLHTRCRWRLHTIAFYCSTLSREAVNFKFYSLWFELKGNRIRVWRFSSRSSIYSNTSTDKILSQFDDFRSFICSNNTFYKTLYIDFLCLVVSNKQQIQWTKIRRNPQEQLGH